MNDSCGIGFREPAFRFTCDIFDFCEELATKPGMGRRVAYQLFDAVSSIDANLEESKYWLRVANAKSLGDKQLRERLLREADEWVAMLTTGMKNLRG